MHMVRHINFKQEDGVRLLTASENAVMWLSWPFSRRCAPCAQASCGANTYARQYCR